MSFGPGFLVKSEPLLPETQSFADRVTANGGTIEDGALEGLYDPLIRELKAQGHYADTVFLGAASAVEEVSGSIATLFDAGGNQNDATQSTSSARPTLTTPSSFGGRQVGDYDGSDDFMALPFAIQQPFTVIVVALYTGEFDFAIDDSDTRVIVGTGIGSNMPRIRAGVTVVGNKVILNDSTIITGVFDGPDSRARLNGVTEVTGDAGNEDFSSPTLHSDQRYRDVIVAGAIVVDVKMTDPENKNIEDILSSYYGSIY